MGSYVVVLGPAAKTFVLRLGSKVERDDLAASLNNDLGETGPNAGATYLFAPWDDGHQYAGRPLYNGVVAIYRPLSQAELRDQRRHGRRLRSGYMVVDFLAPEEFFKHGLVPRALA